MKKQKRNHLLESVAGLFATLPRGRVLDLGCGAGEYSKRLKDLGFEVVASDIDDSRFQHKGVIEFQVCDITKSIRFADESFDYVLLMEVVEHLKNPYTVLAELNRIIKSGGSLVLSTPNILNLKSRFRFMFEAVYDYFREPPLDQTKNTKEIKFNLHLFPYRYHEIEYLIAESGFQVSKILTSIYEGFGYGIFLPIIRFQAWLREQRSQGNKGVDFKRINRILLSRELLFGRHLVVLAQK